MDLARVISEEAILIHLKVNSKKHLFHTLAERASDVTGLPADDICEALQERERLGSTGLGAGVAIPHARLGSIDRIYGVFATLDSPISFDAVDNLPVDIVFTLLAPEDAGAEHLRTLAKVSRLLRDSQTCEKLRGCTSVDGAFIVLMEDKIHNAA